MTQEQQDAAWLSLPEDYKRQLRYDYTTAKSAHSLDPKNERIDAHIIYLEKYFGKHNLTVSKVVPRFKVGDEVTIIGKGMLHGLLGTIGKYRPDTNLYLVHIGTITQWLCANSLELYTRPSSSTAQNCEKSAEKGVSDKVDSLTKEDAEELVKCLTAVDNFIKQNKDSQVDWLAYRMELAKEVVNGLLFTGKSPETIADETTTIVNGIVERLKGGEK